MEYRLRRYEKEAIRKEYKDHALYKAFAAPCKKYEVQSDDFYMSPEELFWECIGVLDDIKENPSESRFLMQGLWNEKFVDYQELSPNASRGEIEIAANMVTLCVAICLNSLDQSLYNTLTSIALGQLQGDGNALVEMREAFMSSIYKFGEERFNAVVVEYMDSDVFISEDITGLIEELPQFAESNSDTEGDTDYNLKAIAKVLSDNANSKSPVYLSDEKGAKIDIIRVLYVLYELGMFHGKDGAKLLKKDFFTAIGKAINKDLSNYDKDLSRSTSDSTALEKHLRIFVDMKKKMEEIWNSK